MAPSAFRRSMIDVFGDPDSHGWILVKESLPVLRGMLAMTNNRKSDENPYMQMINAIQSRGKIKVWMEY